MTAGRRSSGANNSLTIGKRRAGGVMVDIANGYRRQSGAWVQIWSSAPPISISGATNYYSSGTVGGFARTKSATAALSVSGGNGSYSYSWAKTGESLYTATATNCSDGSILNPTFSSSVQPDGSAESDWQLTVTSGSQTKTYNIHVSLSN